MITNTLPNQLGFLLLINLSMLKLLTLQEPSKNGAKRKKPIQQQLDEVQDHINKIQMQPVHLQDHSLEVNLISQYEQNLTKLTEFYRQRAKKH
jgi:hypothetical protein